MNIKNQLIKRLNLSKLLWPTLANGLYCFNFHRIGKWQDTAFDPCVFSCDDENFRHYLMFLNRNFRIITLEELTNIIENKTPITEKLALLTFDDGYADNYHIAYPILTSLNLPATFFITTSLVDSNIIPWWDEMAWHVKHCAGKTIKLNDWRKAVAIEIPASRENIKKVLQQVKANPTTIDNQLKEISDISQRPVPDNLKDNAFISWQQLIEMSKNNMSIGAHSHTHKIFSCLTEPELNFELEESKKLLEWHLQTSVNSLSYPVGGANTYHRSMFDTISAKGYKIGFSFRTITNSNPQENRFELGRLSIDQPFNKRQLMEMILSAEQPA
tara:strand:+ start:1114 stop:2100 length:987 start_codon:yes stop_codon:yes gene_type:complete